MVSSKAKTVTEYLDDLPEDRRPELERVLNVVRQNLPEGYEEAMNWGMIAWQIPLSRYPNTYNKQPMMLAALADQKNYISLYLTPVYAVPAMLDKLLGSGKKLKMGKSCINFKRADELPLESIGGIISACTVDKYIAVVEKARGGKSGR